MKVNTQDMRHKILRTIGRIPKAADNDKLLISLVWQEEGWSDEKSLFENLSKVSSSETIRRTRQKLVEEGLIKPSANVTHWRRRENRRIMSMI